MLAAFVRASRAGRQTNQLTSPRLTFSRTQRAGRCRPQATPDFGQSLPELRHIRYSSPRYDDFEILAGHDHRGVAGSVETPDQLDDIPGQRFLAGVIEGFERLEHRPVEFPEKTNEVRGER
jgi:hypothetical protein